MPCRRKSRPGAGILLLVALVQSSAAQEPRQTRSADGQIIRVETQMVSLPVVVTDREGRHVKNLKEQDFIVSENGVKQEIAGFAPVEEPISIALMVDTSGSTEFQLKRIQDEAIRFVKLLRPDDSVALLSFADDVRLLEQFSIYHRKNPEAIRQTKPGGLSAVYEAVWLTLEQVLKPEYGRKALVLFSDGVDNRSETVSKEETLKLARETESPIYCVYFNTDQDRYKRIPPLVDRLMVSPFQRIPGLPRIGSKDSHPKHPEYIAGHEYMMNLSAYSGGLLFDASQIEDLGPAFQRVARELASQYSIGYYPKNSGHDGTFRRIEVKMNRPGLVARTKQGYFMPAQ